MCEKFSQNEENDLIAEMDKRRNDKNRDSIN